ncbi:MAG: trigger factor [Bryobacteraceae bacterium]|nr:trigger factor [Bryobacteraceae bacterium]
MAFIEGCKHELEIFIPVDDVQKEHDRVAEKIRGRAHLQGFRPGKAPLSMIRKHYASNIRQEVLDNLLPRFFRQKAEEERLEPIGNPNVTDLEYEEGRPIRFKAEFEVAPDIELGDYRGVTVPYDEPKVSDEDVDQQLERLRAQKADYVNLDPRPAELGDVAVIDLHSTAGLEGAPIHGHDLKVELGAEDTLSGFSENIPGMSPGEEKHFSITYPEEYAEERLAGKTVEFRVNLKMLQKKELPELDDEFAKDLGDFQHFEELKAQIRTNILREREYMAQRAAKEEITRKLAESHAFPVPEAFIDRQIELYINRFLSEQQQMGRDPKQIPIDFEKIKEAMRDRAAMEIRSSMLVDRISEREAIATTQDEVDREIQRYAKENREPVAAVRKKWQEDGTLQRVARAIRTEKTLNFLFENARKVAPDEAAGTALS